MIKTKREQNAEIIRNHFYTIVSGDTVVYCSNDTCEMVKVLNALVKCSVTFSVWRNSAVLYGRCSSSADVSVELYMAGEFCWSSSITDDFAAARWPELGLYAPDYVL